MEPTRFYKKHVDNNAKMVEFAGFNMPIQYPKGIIHEHMVVRQKVGVFDVSHMGEFELRGADAFALVQKLTVNDASKLSMGKIQYSAMPLPTGGLVDDLLVYNCGDYHMLVVNASNMEKDLAWVKKNAEAFANVEIKNVSEEMNLLAVQGPDSVKTLQKLTDTNLSEIEYYNFKFGKLAGVDMILSRTGYTGELGFELYFRGDVAVSEKIWDEIFKAGEEFGIEPIGLGARDTLRLEKGFALYGNDIDENTNTIEANLGWITKLAKGEFNGSDVIGKAKAEGTARKLMPFIVKDEKFIPRHGYKVVAGDKEIGEVTSGNISPVLGKGIGMAYVPTEIAKEGNVIAIAARGKTFEAEITKLPFVK